MTTTDDPVTSASPDCFAGEYEPSPVPRIRDQVALYQATDGAEGNTLEDRRHLSYPRPAANSKLIPQLAFAGSSLVKKQARP